MKARTVMVAAAMAALSLGAMEYVPNPAIQNVETNVTYGSHERSVLDVMWTKDRNSGFPVLVWFHGGGLVNGDKFFLPLTDHHIVQVAVRYPFLKEDGSVTVDTILEESAKAVAWTIRNARKYGGDPKKVFVSGHSAGGYITMMLGMDPKWLGKCGYAPTDLCGIAPLSGQATTHFNVRKFRGDKDPQFLPKIDEYAPLGHVAEKGFPPMLIACGDPDSNEWKCRAEECELLAASIRACGHPKDVEYVRIPHTDHGSMRFPGYMMVQNFVRKYAPYPKRKK